MLYIFLMIMEKDKRHLLFSAVEMSLRLCSMALAFRPMHWVFYDAQNKEWFHQGYMGGELIDYWFSNPYHRNPVEWPLFIFILSAVTGAEWRCGWQWVLNENITHVNIIVGRVGWKQSIYVSSQHLQLKLNFVTSVLLKLNNCFI